MVRRSYIGVIATATVLIGCSNNKQAEVDLPAPVVVDPVVVAEPPSYPTQSTDATFYNDGARTYSVRRGDTLWSLASRYYSNGQRWRDISAANPSVDPKRMRVGQMIVIP